MTVSNAGLMAGKLIINDGLSIKENVSKFWEFYLLQGLFKYLCLMAETHQFVKAQKFHVDLLGFWVFSKFNHKT